MDYEQVRKTKAYKDLKKNLIDKLERSGNDQPCFEDLVDTYMSMYITTVMCKDDIKQRGLNVTSYGSTGQLITKKNDSIDTLLKTNQQMIKLLDKLGIEPDAAIEDDEEM